MKHREFKRLLLFWSAGVGCLFSWSACWAVAPTLLVTNLSSPGNIIVDGSSVYWIDGNHNIGSISKIPNGGAVINYSGMVDWSSTELAQDNVFLYFVGATGFAGEPSICKVSKTGGFVNTISDPTQAFAVAGGPLVIGPVGGVLYYDSDDNNPPNDIVDIFQTVVSLSTLGGPSTILAYPAAGLDAGGPDGPGDYEGLAALQFDGLNYFLGGSPGSFSVDSADLYMEDGNSIWSMSLVGGGVSQLVSGRNGIRVIATPTTGAAAGSIFWTEAGAGGTGTLMRREVGGQIITVATNLTGVNRCFAVDNDKVFCGQGFGLSQISINGGTPTVISTVIEVFGPVGVAVDANYIYCSTVIGQIARIPRPGVTPDTTKPTSTITSPTANQRLAVPLIHFSGTAGDNTKVAAVYYQFNTNAWMLAGTTNGYTNWSVTLPLPAGTNTAKEYAVDSSGNFSTTNNVSFFSTNAFFMRFSTNQTATANGLLLTLNVSTGVTVRVDVSTNLLTWTTLTNFTSASTAVQFLDHAATNGVTRFYRSVVQ